MFAEQAPILARDGLITFAGSVLEPNSVKDGYSPVLIADQSRFLKLPRCNADSGPAHAEHDRDKILRQRKLLPAAPVMSSQQPARQTLAKFVMRVACRCLGNLNGEQLHITQQDIADIRAAGKS